MARRSLPSFIALWQKHESLYCAIFKEALQGLASKKSITGDEDALSEQLCPILSQICFDLGQAKNIEVAVPNWEGPIQPVLESELAGGKKRKRPDFSCNLVNPHAQSIEEHEVSYHVECKRLGKPTSPTWILNKNYVTEGMQRFDNEFHGYGKRVISGMMIGYLIDMDPKQVQTEVNTHKKQLLNHFPDLAMQFGHGIPFQYRQDIIRKHIGPKQFHLKHMWVDLRKTYHLA